jgi:hypothetical protein
MENRRGLVTFVVCLSALGRLRGAGRLHRQRLLLVHRLGGHTVSGNAIRDMRFGDPALLAVGHMLAPSAARGRGGPALSERAELPIDIASLHPDTVGCWVWRTSRCSATGLRESALREHSLRCGKQNQMLRGRFAQRNLTPTRSTKQRPRTASAREKHCNGNALLAELCTRWQAEGLVATAKDPLPRPHSKKTTKVRDPQPNRQQSVDTYLLNETGSGGVQP